MDPGLVAGVVIIGFVHGVLPDHGWPIAAMYGLNRTHRWFHGTVAGLVLGIGHLFSSVVLVLAYFWFSRFAAFADGPWLRYVAGVLLILLGIHEYRHGGHGTQHDHDEHAGHEHNEHSEREHNEHSEHEHDGAHAEGEHDHANSGHEHNEHHPDDTETESQGLLARVRSYVPGGGHSHLTEDDAERGLVALGTTALLLGFAHEEPVQILAICAGTPFCLELMLIYSLAVIVAILIPTLLLIAGYERHQERVERWTPYLPLVTATVLIAMGLAFIFGVL